LTLPWVTGSFSRMKHARLWVGFISLSLLFSAACTSKPKEELPNTLRLAQRGKVKGLDPIYADDTYAGEEVSRAYEGLLQFHYLKRPYVLIPALAEAMPEVSKDRLTFTFKIKKGVLFHDDASFKDTGGKGRELTAEDFVYSFKRLADPKLISTGWWLLDGKIAGLNEWRQDAQKKGVADYAAPVSGLKASDRYTLEIKLLSRAPSFLYSLAMPFTSVVAREAVESYGKDFLNHAVGTGPFRLMEFSSNSRLIWAKNPTYRQETYPSEGEQGDKEAGLLADAGQPLPRADRIEVQVYVEDQPMWLTFLSGKLDLSAIPKDNFQQAITPGKELSRDLSEQGVRLVKSPMLDVTHYTFNMSDPVVGKNKYLRQAMSLVYDSGPLIELFYNGRALAAQGPIPPGLSGHDPKFRNPYRQFNIGKAKELMVKAGYPGGQGLPPLTYITTAGSTERQMTEYAVRVFDTIGVKLQIEAFSWPEFQQAVRNRKGQIWSFAWNADYPDAENFLQLFYSKNASPGPNDSNYSNPEYDRLYEKSLGLPDGAERTAVYRQMVNLLVEDCPWIFGVHRIAFGLVQPWVKNYKRSDFHGASKYYRVEREK